MTSTSNLTLSHLAVRGMVWRYSTYFITKLMIFVSTIVMARLLTKDDFGVVGFAITTISLLEVLSAGTGPALVYFPLDKRTTATTFWLAQFIGIALFGLSWVLAPIIAAYFRDDRVVMVVRALALTFPLNALGDIHSSLSQKQLAFDRIFIPEFLLAMVKGGISIVLALLGFGAWSLIWGQILGSLAWSIAFWIVEAWRPSFSFDFHIARLVLDYGVKFISVNFISMIVLNVDYLLVGRYLGAEALGVYTLAFRLPDLLIKQFASILSRVLFPLYTLMRDVPGSLAQGFFRTTRYVSLVTVPLGLGLALIVRPLVMVVFSDKWVDAIPVIQAIAVYVVFSSFAYNAGSAYKAQGRPQVITWLETARLAVLFPALWWAVVGAKSLVAVGWMQALVALLASIFDLSIAAHLLGLPLYKLGIALRPSIIAGLLMSVVVAAIMYVAPPTAYWAQLTFSIMFGAAAYVGALWLLQRDVVLEALELLSKSLNRGVS
jgi:PST family polysaccharide transporter